MFVSQRKHNIYPFILLGFLYKNYDRKKGYRKEDKNVYRKRGSNVSLHENVWVLEILRI